LLSGHDIVNRTFLNVRTNRIDQFDKPGSVSSGHELFS